MSFASAMKAVYMEPGSCTRFMHPVHARYLHKYGDRYAPDGESTLDAADVTAYVANSDDYPIYCITKVLQVSSRVWGLLTGNQIARQSSSVKETCQLTKGGTMGFNHCEITRARLPTRRQRSGANPAAKRIKPWPQRRQMEQEIARASSLSRCAARFHSPK